MSEIAKTMKDNSIYISVDIEADGPIPGEYSMLSIGACAFKPDGTEHGRFWTNIERLPNAKQHPDTMAWWKTQPEGKE